MPLTIVALLILFSLQRRGTGQIGGLFGPVMSLWFVVLGALVSSGSSASGVLVAVNPVFAVEFLWTHSARRSS